MSRHHCHATCCNVPIRPTLFMCSKHWFMLPKPIRSRVWATYRHGQCDDWNPSREYCLAAKEAVVYLAKLEQREPDTRVYDMFLGEWP